MKRKKYEYVKVLQQDFGGGDGWEDICEYKEGTPKKEIRSDVDACIENQPYPVRVINRRNLIEKDETL